MMDAAEQAARYYAAEPHGLSRPPRASLAFGAAGVAYFLLRYAAGCWARIAESTLGEPDAFFGHGYVTPATAPKSSLYYNEPGVWCVRALVAQAQEEQVVVRRATQRYAELAGVSDAEPWDTMIGIAGLLHGAASLFEAIRDVALRDAGDRLAAQLAATPASRGAVDRGSRFGGQVGAAHGPAGVAHALLRWCEATGEPPGERVLRLIEILAERHRRPDGLWPIKVGADEVWGGWCSGSAGWTLLWTLAWRLTGEEEMLRLAGPVARDAGLVGRGEEASLCCGLAGRAFAALAVFRITGAARWHEIARDLAAQAVDNARAPHLLSGSLFNGDLGVALAALEVEHPDAAAMPLYERSPRLSYSR